MRRILVRAAVFFVFGLSCVYAQTQDKTLSQLPEIEPFKIERGVSFNASTPRSTDSQSNSGTGNLSRDFSEALKIIRENHVDGKNIDHNEITKSSINAMLRTLDPHSNYFDSEEYQDLLTDQRSEYYGIGATIANYQHGEEFDTFVISTFPDSPASRAGLQFGDKIVAVNNELMTGKSSTLVRDKVRGRKGTAVRLTVERAETRKIEIVELRRNRVPQPSIPDAYLLRQNIGYIDLSVGFNYTTSEELTVALNDLRAQGMNALILDLRDNPGGILEQAVRVAEKFIQKGEVIVTQRGRYPIDNRTWKSTNINPEKIPLVVLVNENSASASEIVAGALQDYDRALIIGEKTFGKGLVQSIINLPYSAGLTLTTAKYFTPAGRSIQRDYENTNLYDYYNHKNSSKEIEKDKFAARTISGRAVYGGDGISPDETVKPAQLSRTQANLLDSLFFFARELTGGRLRNFETYRTTVPVRYGQRVPDRNFQVTDELFAEFKKFALNNKSFKISAEQIESEKGFIKSRIRFHLATATYGNVAANQVLIESDPQIIKALEALPRALNLAQSARKSQK